MVEENEKNLQGGNQLCLWQKRKQKYTMTELILMSTEKFIAPVPQLISYLTSN